jgi:hypothetical protein
VSIVPAFLQESSNIRRLKMAKGAKKDTMKKDAGLTAKQKKLPPALQAAIMKKQGKVK